MEIIDPIHEEHWWSILSAAVPEAGLPEEDLCGSLQAFVNEACPHTAPNSHEQTAAGARPRPRGQALHAFGMFFR